ncbi:MAG: hypothetical protein E7500_00500 [Ruminococcus sp.]|nr:hypothetical protein [Ruminococcus sp.]
MKLKALLSTVVSAVLITCTMGTYIPSAETTVETYTLSFDISDEGFETEDESLFASVELKAGGNYIIPEGSFETEERHSTGWTYDDIYLYAEGDNFVMPAQDVVLRPVYVSDVDNATYTVSYNIEGYTHSEEVSFDSFKRQPGRPVSPTTYKVNLAGASQAGWYYKGNIVLPTQKFVMPAEDVVLTPRFLYYYTLTYSAGEVDRLTSTSNFVAFDRCEFESLDLAAADRFGRIGFNLVGWTSSIDGLVYKPGSPYVMPGQDLTFTAVWEPKTYVVVFAANNGKSESIKISGQTDTYITVPECTFTKSGYKFAGWSYNDELYQPGDEFLIYGAKPGLGISLKASWVEDIPEVQEPYDSLSLVLQRKEYVAGTATEEDLKAGADFLLGR